MEQQPFYAHLNVAKKQFGDLRIKVNEAKRDNNPAGKILLSEKIKQTIYLLTKALPFFKVSGKGCEVNVLIICYLSLQGRLNSS